VIRVFLLVFIFFLAPITAIQAQTDGSITGDSAVDDALKIIRGGNIDKGMISLQRLAEQGNPEAMFHVAEMYRLGVGRDASVAVATMYYRFASQLGHARGSLSLANILFFEGAKTEKEYGEALDIWQRFTLEGNLEASYMLGMVYWNGEAGIPRDPIRGYALVWLAAQGGYADAEQNVLSMQALLSHTAKETAYEYANDIKERGFSDEPLALNLLLEDTEKTLAPKPEPKKELPPLEMPDDWSTVWHIEVGFAMTEQEVERLHRVIYNAEKETVGDLFSEIAPSANRPGLYRLLYGPTRSMIDSVNRCVVLKRAGHDCFARAPEEDDDEY